MQRRNKFGASFKAKVGLEAVKKQKGIERID